MTAVRDWLLKRWTGREWAAGVLTGLMLACLPWGLSEAGWLQSNAVLWWAASLGLLAGLLVSRIASRPAPAATLILTAGLLFTAQYQGDVLPPPGAGLRELDQVGSWAGAQLRAALSSPFARDAAPVRSAPPAAARLQASYERLSLYTWNLRSEWPPDLRPNPRRDQMLLGSLLGLLTWCGAAMSIWMLRRPRMTGAALIPVLGLLVFSTYYTWRGWGSLLLGTACGLLVMGDSTFSSLERRWRSGALPYGISLEWWGWAGLSALLAAGVMGTVIMLTDPDFADWVDRVLFGEAVDETGQQAAAGGQGSSGAGVTTRQTGILPRQHLIGSDPALSERPVMTVHTPEAAPARFYWRAGSYDEYTGLGWLNNPSDDLSPEAAPLWPASIEPPPDFILLRQIVRLANPSRRIYAAGRPVWASVPAEGEWFDEGGADLIAAYAQIETTGYEVLSWVPTASPERLREADETYPGWVMGYLALPEGLPARVTELAEEITAGAQTPYDRAAALQNYLRTYPYTLDLPAPPADRDVVDYFLFDLKQGYCDYYASAMVVMARAVGLPARLAIGFASGEYDPALDAYHVRVADSHSWVEVYFAGYGWVPFEPTAGRPLIEHGLPGLAVVGGAEIPRAAPAPPGPGGLPIGGIPHGWLLIALPAALLALIAGGLALGGWRSRRIRGKTPQEVLTAIYRELLHAAARLGVPVSSTTTPYELRAALAAELARRARDARRRPDRWVARAGNTVAAVEELTRLYAEGCYSPRQPTGQTVDQARALWRAAAPALQRFWLAGLATRLTPWRSSTARPAADPHRATSAPPGDRR
ncbi:MAG: hypothetical protein Kow00124_27600 [Anaerolineae bacterium]